MSSNLTAWVADKLRSYNRFERIERVADGRLLVNLPSRREFPVAVLGRPDVVELADVEPLFTGDDEPEFVVNVPSSAIWHGDAIRLIHSENAAFGTLGDVVRAAQSDNAGSFRDKNMHFFINAMRQHTHVARVSYVFDSVFQVDRVADPTLIVAVIDAYNMSAEDVRNARSRYGQFDVVVKSTSHGSITAQAADAAKWIGAEALSFRDLMARLSR